MIGAGGGNNALAPVVKMKTVAVFLLALYATAISAEMEGKDHYYLTTGALDGLERCTADSPTNCWIEFPSFEASKVLGDGVPKSEEVMIDGRHAAVVVEHNGWETQTFLNVIATAVLRAMGYEVLLLVNGATSTVPARLAKNQSNVCLEFWAKTKREFWKDVSVEDQSCQCEKKAELDGEGNALHEEDGTLKVIWSCSGGCIRLGNVGFAGTSGWRTNAYLLNTTVRPVQSSGKCGLCVPSTNSSSGESFCKPISSAEQEDVLDTRGYWEYGRAV